MIPLGEIKSKYRRPAYFFIELYGKINYSAKLNYI